MAAYKVLGPFIAAMQQCHPSEKLLDPYSKKTDTTINSLSNENEVK